MANPLEHLQRTVLRRQGFTSRFLATSTGPRHVYDVRGYGALPPIVLLHGIGANASSFGNLMRQLRPHTQRIIAPDLPGHGFSAESPRPLGYPDVFAATAEVLALLAPGRVLLFGNSLGGACALHCALEAPELVHGLVLSSPAGAPTPAGLYADFVSRFQMRTVSDALAFLRRVFYRQPWYVPFAGPTVKRMLGGPVVQTILASVRPGDGITPEQLLSLTMPILFVWGKGEKLLLPAHLDYFRQHLPPQARVLEPETFGHCPHLEQAGTVAQLIVAFAQDIAATPTPLAATARLP